MNQNNTIIVELQKYLSYDKYIKNKEVIDEILKTLEPKEEKVIRLLMGLDDNRPHTQDEIARQFGVTTGRVRQIAALAIRRLRHPARSKILESLN